MKQCLVSGWKRPYLRTVAARLLILGCGASLFAGSVFSGAAARDAAPSPPAAVLVGQLGAETYAVRERASRSLLDLGIAAKPALTEALRHPDAEVRHRAATILAVVTHADFLVRLDAFAADVDGKQSHDLPAWDLFRATAGEDRSARALFVAAQRDEPRLLQALAADPKEAAALFSLRFVDLQQELQAMIHEFGEQQDQIGLGSIAALLLAGSADNITIDEDSGTQLCLQLYQPNVQAALRSGEFSRPLGKLLARWIVRDNGPNIALQNLMLAQRYHLKSEGLTLAMRALTKDGGQVSLRQFAVMFIGLYGGRSHIADLQPLLKDSTPSTFQPPASSPFGIRRQIQVEIRDVALTVCLHLTGQKPQDYGLVVASKDSINADRIFTFSSYGFINATHREAALKKWNKWFAGNADR